MNPEAGLSGICAGLRHEFEAKNQARETALRACREIVQLSARAIRATHRQESAEADALMESAAQAARELQHSLAEHPDLAAAGYVHDALKELVEARVVAAIVRKEALPEPEALGVGPATYLNGLAEAASECRRYVLDRMKEGALSEADRIQSAMDAIYAELITFDFPDALTGGLRRTTDALRPVLERTRGDVTLAYQNEALANLLRETSERLSSRQGA